MNIHGEMPNKRRGSIHVEHILEYNEKPENFADLLLHRLTLEAQKSINASELSRRQVAKRLKISVPQLYRLLDCANTRKSMKQLLALLHIPNCDVDLVVKNNEVTRSAV